jgi:hypothetical protein
VPEKRPVPDWSSLLEALRKSLMAATVSGVSPKHHNSRLRRYSGSNTVQPRNHTVADAGLKGLTAQGATVRLRATLLMRVKVLWVCSGCGFEAG